MIALASKLLARIALPSLANWRVEIGGGFASKAGADLFTQDAGRRLEERALFKLAELKRAERHADQAIDRQAEMFEHALDFAVLTFAQTHRQPDVGALHAIKLGL